MPTGFPASLDSFTNPNATDTLSAVPHAEQHTNANTAIESLQAKVGINGSAVTSSLDFLIKQGQNPGHKHTFSDLVLDVGIPASGSTGALQFNAGNVLSSSSQATYDAANNVLRLGTTGIPASVPSTAPKILATGGLAIWADASTFAYHFICYEPGGAIPRSYINQSSSLMTIAQGDNGGSIRMIADSSGGTATEFLRGSATVLTVNETAADIDFRVEGTSNTHLLLADAGLNRVAIGTSSPTAMLDINGDVLRLRTSKTPASASSDGRPGDICWDSSYVYVCVGSNTWKRAALTTW